MRTGSTTDLTKWMDQRGVGAFVTRQIVTVASTGCCWQCSCCSILLVLLVDGRPQNDTGAWYWQRSVSSPCIIFGMRRPSSTRCFVVPLAKNPSNTSLFFCHCPSPAKRPWELIAYHNRACACSSVILSTFRSPMAGRAVPATKVCFQSPLVIEQQFVGGCQQEEVATMWLCGPSGTFLVE